MWRISESLPHLTTYSTVIQTLLFTFMYERHFNSILNIIMGKMECSKLAELDHSLQRKSNLKMKVLVRIVPEMSTFYRLE